VTSPLIPATSARPFGRPWILVTAGWLVVGLLSSAQSVLLRRLESESAIDLATALLGTVPGWLVYALVTPVVVWVTRRWPLTPGGRGRAVVAHSTLALLTTIVHTTVVIVAQRAAYPDPMAARPLMGWAAMYLTNRLLLELITYGAIAGAVIALDAQRRLRTRELASAALETRLAQAQLQALQGQLQPHFLFNTLNAIGVLVREDPAAAERVVSLLADLLRRTLDTAQQQEVPLREEIDFLQRYLEIERTRFPDRLTIAVEIPEAIGDLLVPSFLLQPLVENAVRYGIAPRTSGGRVVVRGRRAGADLVLEVWNDGAPLAGDRREGIGLGTTRERLQRLYGPEATLTLASADGGVCARVTLPAQGAS
jgi:two-component system, LytTR family, sensor kinase